MAHESILIIEDEADIRELIAYNLEREGFVVRQAESAEEAAERIEKSLPDLILLDLMLPGKDGVTFCRELRADERVRGVPLIMLTARGEDIDEVTGLEVGADDYVTKPFSPRVLIARIRAVLRRGSGGTEELVADGRLRRGAVEIDRSRHQVRVNGEDVSMTLTEFRVLEALMRRPGVVFSRYQIVDAVRGEDYPVTDRSVDVQIVGLRKKLGDYSYLIETVRGVGYRFTATPREETH